MTCHNARRIARTTVEDGFGHARPDALTIPEDDVDKLLLSPPEAATALGIGRSKVYEPWLHLWLYEA